MLLTLVFVAFAVAGRTKYCTSAQSSYSDTKAFIKADGTPYRPDLVARPAWFRQLSSDKRLDFETRINKLLEDPTAAGTGCCLERMTTGVSAGTKRVMCKRAGRSAPRPRVGGNDDEEADTPVDEPVDEPIPSEAVPGEPITGWPRMCANANGLSLGKIRRVLGVGGGADPVTMGKGRLIARERTCNAITGCKKWTAVRSPEWSNLARSEFEEPEVRIQVVNDQVQIDFYSAVPASSSRCHNRIFLTPGEKVINLAKFDVAYNRFGSRGCTAYGLRTQPGGNTEYIPMKGVMAESCLSLFSEVHERDTPSGKIETQLAFYAEF